ncbi:MAG TPA: class II glutamine amidotransferase [Polyangiaceae bacterium]|nr:class II glutamine amidotransferase [Polyangiaceae bacterium]
MCRLFGFRSVIPSKVHRSLLAAENALGVQSNQHPDGWGVAFYVDGSPHVTRSPSTALGDSLFHRLSGVVSSQTVLAHVRKATQGPLTVLNCHPFQYGRWVFAHNGDVPNFEARRETLIGEIAPELRRFILGETDSEVVFFLFLTLLAEHGPLAQRFELDTVSAALGRTVQRIRELADPGASSPPLLTLMVTDGELLVASEGGRDLYWSSYKRRCSDRERCSSLSAVCEAPTRSGHVNHFIVSSEPLQGENVWERFAPGEIVAVDREMRLHRAHVERRGLPVLLTA